MNKSIEEGLITKRDLAEFLKVHIRTISRLTCAGTIPAIKVGKCAVRYRLSAVLQALEGEQK